ncbi:MAG: hypothetical protein ACRDGU_06090 [Actinomycetota bacterium]
MPEPDKLSKAPEQLARVQVAWTEPVDWSDLAIYGFYGLENAVVAAADHFGLAWKTTHPSKVEAARSLHQAHGLPDIADLLTELNSLRKSEAYGEVQPSETLSPEDIAVAVEDYIEAVAGLFQGDG